MNIRLIACIDNNNGLGLNNKLLYNIKDDMQHFKNLTTGQVVVMGRKTFDSLPNGPLKDRENFVISRTMKPIKGVHLYRSVEDFLIGGQRHQAIKGKRIYVIGGGQIYEQFIKHANHIDLTVVNDSKPADSFFPEIDPDLWEISISTSLMYEGKTSYTYVTHKRKTQL